MLGALGFIGNVIMGVIDSNNKREVDICHDNNNTKIEIGKLVLGGVTMLGTLALQFYCKSDSEN